MDFPSPEMSIEDIIDDLDLHRALLESLLDSRPGDLEEKQDLESTVQKLERKLAERRGVPYQPQPAVALSRGPLISEVPSSHQVGGARMFSSPSRSGYNNQDADRTLSLPRRDSLTRKRHLDPADFGGSPNRSSSKRARTPVRMNPYSERSREIPFDFLDDLDVPDDDVIDLRSGQFEAERMLRDRREQERRDAEFAKRLQSTLDGELAFVGARPAQSFQSQLSRAYSSDTKNHPAARPSLGISTPEKPKPGLSTSRDMVGPSTLHQQLPPSSYRPYQGASSAVSFGSQHPESMMRPTQNFQVIDSSDDDLAEIAANDFYSGSPQRFTSKIGGPTTQSFDPYKMGVERMRGLKSALDYLPAGRVLLPWMLNESDNDVQGTSSWMGGYEVESVDSKKANEELKELLESLRPDIELPKDGQGGTPKELSFALFEHQKLGLAWMKAMEEGNNKGGILADDMGLGKTVQALSLIVSRPSTDPSRKTTLIIAPVALMQQWQREIDRLIKPENKLSVFILHGEKRKTSFNKLKKYDVVLTTFGSMGTELKRLEQFREMRRFASQNSANMIAEAQQMPLLSPESKWYRVIIDEAQCIKNRNTKSALACCSLNATYRWCMSGTPMMNGVHELHSLLKFLRIPPFNNLERFNSTFTRPLKNGSGRDKALQQLRVVLKAILLRRTKFSKIDGKPLINLPPRTTEKVHAVFSEDEQELYNSLESRTQIQFNKYLAAGTVGRNYSNILVLLLRLRQACCHPHLIKDLSVDVSAVTEQADFIENAKNFDPDVVRRLKENAPLECPVCIDAVENAIIFYPCGHATCVECFAKISDPSIAVQQGVDGSVEVKCPNCRGKVDPKKVTDHVAFKKVHFPDQLTGQEDEEVVADKAEETESDSDSDDSDDDDSDLADFIVPDDYDSEDDDTVRRKKQSDEDVESDDKDQKKAEAKKSKKSKKSSKGKGKDKGRAGGGRGGRGSKPNKTLAVLRREGQRNAASKRKYFKRLEKNWITSAKIDKAIEVLEGIKNSGSGEKTIIFSQFTSLLDLLEVPIYRHGWKYRRYDGSMRPRDRNESVLEFTDNPECDIMLVSLKAGNAGLNLVAASQVIIFDPFWNPYIEEQAIDRAHRLGQTRPVQIHRILIENSVEDRILSLQDQKREVIEGALDENAASQISRLGVRELKFLFNVK